MKASELERKFDEGVEDVIDGIDLSVATRPNRDQKRVTATRAVDADDVNPAVRRERRAQVGATKTRLAPRSRSRR